MVHKYNLQYYFMDSVEISSRLCYTKLELFEKYQWVSMSYIGILIFREVGKVVGVNVI